MNHLKKLMFVGAIAASMAGCGDEPTDTTGTTDSGVDVVVTPGACDNAPATLTVSENIAADTTWCTGTTVTLSTRIYVVGEATLTIQPGVVVHGMNGSALVITRHGHLSAIGTAAAPIVMTSDLPVGTRMRGNWGGLVLFGRAPNNVGNDVVFEGLAALEENTYGGTDAAWNCGQIKYLRVEFAGQVFSPNKEFNGITFASCGSATSASYVQIHNGADDGIEFFGGSANVDHAVITGADDDGLDYDNGWVGHIQYYIVQHTGTVGDNAIEADNNANGTTSAPRSSPTIFNASFFGNTMKSRKVTLRRATFGRLFNSIFQDFTGGLKIEPPTTVNEASATYQAHWPADLVFANSFFAMTPTTGPTLTNAGDLPQLDPTCVSTMAMPCAKDTSVQGTFDLATLIGDVARGNTLAASTLVTIGADTAPNFCPAAATATVSGATAPAGWTDFDTAGLAFAGACAPGTAPAAAWYAGWTSYPAN